MTVKVVFAKNGFYHPAFGRMGRGDKNSGRVYELPDVFKEKGMLPRSAKIIEDKDDLEAALEEAGQTKAVKPKVIDEAQYDKTVAGRGPVRKADSAQKRTTGSDKKPLN